MAPNFALFLSPEGIALAHRQPGGHWAVLGDTALDVPDLGASLLVLRKLAEQRAGKDFETLVILPDDQILYTSLTAPGPDDEDRLDQIRAGLDGLTPYPVDQLAYDWFPLEDGRVKLAVVAQETLEEARAFATGHGFTPAGFGARPLDNRYRGVAHFDRSIDWTAEIADIEFGHDTWHKARKTAETPVEDAPVEEEEQPVNDAPIEADEADKAADASDAPVADETPAPSDSDAPKDDADVPAEDTPAPAEPVAKVTPGPTQLELESDESAEEVEAAASDTPAPTPAPSEPAPKKNADEGPSEPPASEEPLQVPAGFGSRRKTAEPEAAGSLVRSRKSRFGPGADVSADDAPKDPELPRDRKDDPGDRAEPVFGRAARKTPATADAPKASKSGGKKTAPARPSIAGPEPQLPPLARLKSQIAARPTEDRPEPGPNPFAGPPPSLRADKTSLKDRVAGIGRQLSEGTGKARDAASGLSGRLTDGRSSIGKRLRSLGKGEADASETPNADAATVTPEPATEPAATASPSPPPAEPATRKGLGRLGRKKKAEPAAAAQTVAATETITPPAPDTGARRRFTPPKRNRSEPKIADADAPIMGGLLARGSVATSRGPSVKTGLVLTLILLAVLGLVGIWAAFYLPETALGRWMGLGNQDEIIIADTEPEVLDQPLLATPSPSADDAPEVMASLTPEDAPSVPVIAPLAPELLPDIDAEDLDLGPAPVASPVIDPETVLPSEEENANFYARTGVWQRPPVITLPDPEPVLEEVVFAGLDPTVAVHDAFALPTPNFLPSRDLPAAPADSDLSGPLLALDRDTMVAPTPEGAMTPYGILVYAGQPPVAAVPRPRDAPEVLAAAAAESVVIAAASEAEAAAVEEPGGIPPGAVDTALLEAFRPEARPDDLQEQRERAILGGITFDELAGIRPESRPLSLQEEAAAAAEEAAADASPGDVTSASDLAVAVSFLPNPRPGNIDTMVEQARAAGNSGPAPAVAASASDTVQPAIPSSASVTRAAAEDGSINLRNLNLIGISGASGARRALVRLPSGRFVRVEVGDRLDGGQVAAIGESSLQYVKRGRTITLEVPAG
ncbi:hypothetical protein [Nioella aestuarii]|uniref:hypothetical protein n=1 Tax=Nioella aestuarii TaxID=1662864 RepID=UPI003D7F5A89